MYYTQMMQLYNGQNGMPMPKPPVFPPANQQQQQQGMVFNQMPQFGQMPPMPQQQTMQMPLTSTPMQFFPSQNPVFPNIYQQPNNPTAQVQLQSQPQSNNIFLQHTQSPFQSQFQSQQQFQNKP